MMASFGFSSACTLRPVCQVHGLNDVGWGRMQHSQATAAAFSNSSRWGWWLARHPGGVGHRRAGFIKRLKRWKPSSASSDSDDRSGARETDRGRAEPREAEGAANGENTVDIESLKSWISENQEVSWLDGAGVDALPVELNSQDGFKKVGSGLLVAFALSFFGFLYYSRKVTSVVPNGPPINTTTSEFVSPDSTNRKPEDRVEKEKPSTPVTVTDSKELENDPSPPLLKVDEPHKSEPVIDTKPENSVPTSSSSSSSSPDQSSDAKTSIKKEDPTSDESNETLIISRETLAEIIKITTEGDRSSTEETKPSSQNVESAPEKKVSEIEDPELASDSQKASLDKDKLPSDDASTAPENTTVSSSNTTPISDGGKLVSDHSTTFYKPSFESSNPSTEVTDPSVTISKPREALELGVTSVSRKEPEFALPQPKASENELLAKNDKDVVESKLPEIIQPISISIEANKIALVDTIEVVNIEADKLEIPVPISIPTLDTTLEPEITVTSRSIPEPVSHSQTETVSEPDTQPEIRSIPKPVHKIGKILVPPVIDASHEQAFDALRTLKIIGGDLDAAGICKRREYARWLVSASNILSKSTSQRIFPSMFVDGHTEMAFDDVSPDDPDFSFIQGLAESGLVPSKLLPDDSDSSSVPSSPSSAFSNDSFRPDGPLTRQDLIRWKIAIDNRNLPSVNASDVKKISGFIDVDRISKKFLPSIYTDLQAGENSIISSTFGYTRRFEPFKPVTRAQAAYALVTGNSTELIAEEITKLESQLIAELEIKAAAEAEAELLKSKQAVAEAARIELEEEKEKRRLAEVALQNALTRLEEIQEAYLQEKNALDNSKVALIEEQQKLENTRDETEKTMSLLFLTKEAMSEEKRNLEKLVADMELAKSEMNRAKEEVEKQTTALSQARTFASEEAKKAEQEAQNLLRLRKELHFLNAKQPENASVTSALESLPRKFELPPNPEVPWKVDSQSEKESTLIPKVDLGKALEQVSVLPSSLANQTREKVGDLFEHIFGSDENNKGKELWDKVAEKGKNTLSRVQDFHALSGTAIADIGKTADSQLKNWKKEAESIATLENVKRVVGENSAFLEEVAKKVKLGYQEGVQKINGAINNKPS